MRTVGTLEEQILWVLTELLVRLALPPVEWLVSALEALQTLAWRALTT